jgi:hypothetical protein
MANDEAYIEYTKGRDPKGNQDSWAKLKQWRDPIGGSGAPRDGTEKATPAPKGVNKPGDSQA